ncbi:MAG TPA: DUF2231 domain-containing protein [Chthoniobacteraceae bacterium]|jgi:uncharacterized membrane protein|nr:DUF2231 domain-containing protein [Chthoniobacteraceae bacterium]
MTVRPRCLAFVILLLAVMRAPAVEATKEEQLRIAQSVHDIFEAKCIDCHGPELPRPKKKFGYVLDLQRIADNPDFVVRREPDKSEIYKMVANDEMPGEDANVPPLTKEEKEIVRRWVEIGAPGELPGSKKKDSPAVSIATQGPKEPFLKKLFRWIGQFHPASTHFPVALMFVAVFAETIAWYTKSPSWLQTVRFLVILAALGAVNSTILGWINAYFSSYNKATGALLWFHRWCGTLAAVWSIVCAGVLLFGDSREGSVSRRRFRGALILGAALVAVSGFLGAALLYGLDHYAWR